MFAGSQNILAGMAILMTVNKGLEAFKEQCINIDDGDDENGDNVDKDGDDAAGGVQSGSHLGTHDEALVGRSFT